MFAIDIGMVQEVVEWESLEPVPRAPDFTMGVFNYHGRIITVVDLAVFFDEVSGKLSDETRMVVLAGDDLSLGFKVDKTERIENFDEQQLQSGAEQAPDTGFVKAVVNHEYRLYNLIDFGRLLGEIEDRFTTPVQGTKE